MLKYNIFLIRNKSIDLEHKCLIRNKLSYVYYLKVLFMKKIYSLLTVLALSGVVGAQNLVTNPSFEDGLNSWTKGPTGSYTLPTLSTDNPKSGSNSAAYINAGATTGFYQEIPVSANQKYTISLWYKATGDSTDARIWSVYKDADNNIVYQSGSSFDSSTDPLRGPNNEYFEPSSEWKQFTTTVTTPANVVKLQLAVRAYRNGTAYFDDFSVTSGNLGVTDFTSSKYSLVKNTMVTTGLHFVKKAQIQIVNLAGQVVKSAQVSADEVLDLSQLPKGVYVVSGTVNGEKVNQKIVK